MHVRVHVRVHVHVHVHVRVHVRLGLGLLVESRVGAEEVVAPTRADTACAATPLPRLCMRDAHVLSKCRRR